MAKRVLMIEVSPRQGPSAWKPWPNKFLKEGDDFKALKCVEAHNSPGSDTEIFRLTKEAAAALQARLTAARYPDSSPPEVAPKEAALRQSIEQLEMLVEAQKAGFEERTGEMSDLRLSNNLLREERDINLNNVRKLSEENRTLSWELARLKQSFRETASARARSATLVDQLFSKLADAVEIIQSQDRTIDELVLSDTRPVIFDSQTGQASHAFVAIAAYDPARPDNKQLEVDVRCFPVTRQGLIQASAAMKVFRQQAENDKGTASPDARWHILAFTYIADRDAAAQKTLVATGAPWTGGELQHIEVILKEKPRGETSSGGNPTSTGGFEGGQAHEGGQPAETPVRSDVPGGANASPQ